MGGKGKDAEKGSIGGRDSGEDTEDMRKDLEAKDRRIKALEREVEQLKARKDADESVLPLDLLEEAGREDELDRRLSAENLLYNRSVDEHQGESVIVRLTKN